jgi:hypothetical protein
MAVTVGHVRSFGLSEALALKDDEKSASCIRLRHPGGHGKSSNGGSVR